LIKSRFHLKVKRASEKARSSSCKDKNVMTMGGVLPTRSTVDDDFFFNKYTTKKTLSAGLIIGGLLAANAGQLRVLLADQMMNTRDAKWLVPFVLVCFSGAAQLVLLVLLAILANCSLAITAVGDGERRRRNGLAIVNTVVLVISGMVFCVNIVSNVFIQIDFAALLSKATSSSFWSTTDPFAAVAQFNK
jgi:hypothetical protein